MRKSNLGLAVAAGVQHLTAVSLWSIQFFLRDSETSIEIFIRADATLAGQLGHQCWLGPNLVTRELAWAW